MIIKILTLCCFIVALTIGGAKMGTIKAKKEILTVCLITASILLSYVLLYLVGNYYFSWMKTTVAEYDSPDGEYMLVVQQIGHTFLAEGATYRTVLKKGNEIVDSEQFRRNSFGPRDDSFLEVTWSDENVTVFFYDIAISTLSYDGS